MNLDQDRVELLLLILTVCAVVGTSLWLFELLVALVSLVINRNRYGRHRNSRKARRASRSHSTRKPSV